MINDGSTDNSAKIVEKYAEKYKNITLINQKNAGQGAARNNGINNSKSPYITFIDADDYVDCEYLNILYKDLKKNNVDISICDIVKVKKVHMQIKTLARFLIVKKKFIEIKTNLDVNSQWGTMAKK